MVTARSTMRGPAMAPASVGIVLGGGGGGGGGGERQQQQQAERWRHFDNSVSAVSFGFVATAILVSMFLVMAIFEKFLRPRSPFLSSADEGGGGGPRGRTPVDSEAHRRNTKLDFYPSPKMSIYAKGVSVLMPGNNIPTYIAHPAPAPCPPERTLCPYHQQIPIGESTSVPS